MQVKDIYEKIQHVSERSTYRKGVREYALEMLDSIISGNYEGIDGNSDPTCITVGHMLNHVGGDQYRLYGGWTVGAEMAVSNLCGEASRGGNFLIYDEDIVSRLVPKSRQGRLAESPMALQADALYAALLMVRGYLAA